MALSRKSTRTAAAGARRAAGVKRTAHKAAGDAKSDRVGKAWEVLRRHLKEHVDKGVVAGLAARVIVSGKERLFEEIGYADIENKKKMTKKSLVRIYSMTKCVIAAALFQQIEAGRLSLDDKLSDHLPAFANVRVAVEKKNGFPDFERTIPVREPVRIRHLLTHTSGISSGLAPGLDGPRKRGAKERAWAGLYEPLVRGIDQGEFPNLAAWVKELAKLPLIEQPGTHYGYGYSYDVLGHIVELKSGKPLTQYLRERIFEPLGMHDTVFDICDGSGKVRKSQSDRLTVLYRYTKSKLFGSDGKRAKLVRVDPLTKNGVSRWGRPCKVPSGGGGLSSLEGGLLSTMDDYTIFLRTILNGGVHPDTQARILSRKFATLMISDHTADLKGPGGKPVPAGCSPYDDRGLGLSCIGEFQRPGAPSWGHWFDGVPEVRLWGGAASCAFKYDPNNGNPILVVLAAQVLPQEDGSVITNLLKGVRKAIEEENKE